MKENIDMKTKLITLITCLLLMAGFTYGAGETLSLTSGGLNSITLNSGTTSFQLDVSSSWTGYSSYGLSYWLQVPSAVASAFSITNVTYGAAFPDGNQTSPATVQFTDSVAADGAKSGYTIETRDLGGTSSDTTGPGSSAGTYADTSMTISLNGLAPGTYILASTSSGSRPSKENDTSFGTHPFPEADFTITVVPEPATLSLLGLSGLGSVGLTMLRARRRKI
jgi:PEP-CTERM motif